jgi:hypothetical protein
MDGAVCVGVLSDVIRGYCCSDNTRQQLDCLGGRRHECHERGASHSLSQEKLREMLKWLFCCCFQTGSLCTALAALELRDPLASASGGMGLKECTTRSSHCPVSVRNFQSSELSHLR